MEITESTRILLERAAGEVADHKATLKAATAERDDLIREAVRDGYSLRSISYAVGVNHQRIAQIAQIPDQRLHFMATKEAWCPKCDAKPGEKCTGASGMFHAERHDRRTLIHEGALDDVVEGEPGYEIAV